MRFFMKQTLIVFLFLGLSLSSSAESGDKHPAKPKLVVGIVVDQMREDFLYRFHDAYSGQGFRRLLAGGMNFTYAQINYIPTYTAPGHTSIYTGTTPYHHGIISNEWYDKTLRRDISCVADSQYKILGGDVKAGGISPKHLLASTITDQLRMSNNGLSRVFSVSFKDRAAVLSGGHAANAAYWYDGKTGSFVSSTYYMKELPEWMTAFNQLRLPEKLMALPWKLSLDENAYKSSMPDDGPGEEDVFNEGKTTFPHEFGKLSAGRKLHLIRSTPFGNELLTDFAIRMLEEERIGRGDFTDFLAISYSSTDYVGHSYGPNSVEVMDTYVKLDAQIARLLAALDKAVGRDNYLLFLTADHGVQPNNAYLDARGFSTTTVLSRRLQDSLRAFCQRRFGASGVIDTVYDNQIYLNHAVLDGGNPEIVAASVALKQYLRRTFPEMGAIIARDEMDAATPTRTMATMLLNGFHPFRSGDLAFELTSNHLDLDFRTGATHGSSYDYDTHIPLIFYGKQIEPGESNELVFIEDIAPTIANLLHIQEPDNCIGVPLQLKKRKL